ncbi:MAG: SdrD B-like domain-containing protein [Candidatus Saccharimonadales bacterium]
MKTLQKLLQRSSLLFAALILGAQLGLPAVALANGQNGNNVPAAPTECYEQVSWWKVGKVYAEDVYSRNLVKDYKTEYKYKRYKWDWKHYINQHDRTDSRVGNTQYGEWEYYSTTGFGDQRSTDPAKEGHDWFKYVLYDTRSVENGGHYEYTKIHSAGDPYTALYGPYKVSSDPATVPFDVGSGPRVIGDWFNYGQPNYNDANEVIDYTYKLDSQGVENGRRIPCPKPADKVEYTEWEDGEPNCESKSVTPARTKTVTPYVLAQDGFTWIPGTPVVTTESGTPRTLTSDELKDCTQMPEDKITYGEWVDGEWECGDKTVTQTRTKTVTPHKWDGQAWVEDTANATTTKDTTTQKRDLTKEESLLGCTGSITGHKFNDADGDGKWDDDEEALSGFTIRLHTYCEPVASIRELVEVNESDCEESLLAEDVTDEQGAFSFASLEAGTYLVCEVQKDGWTQTLPANNACWKVVVEDKECIVDFGNKAKAPGNVIGVTPTVPVVTPKVLANTGTPFVQGLLVGLGILGTASGITALSRRKQYQA